MTEPGDDFDSMLRSSLRQQAGHAPQLDLTSAALKRARGMRTRRRAVGAVAFVAAAAVAVPVGSSILQREVEDSHIADAETSLESAGPAQEPVDVSLARLPRGDDPQVPYIAGDQLIHEGSASTVPGAPADPQDFDAPALVDAAAFTDGTGAWLHDPQRGSLTFDPGTTSSSLPSSGNVSNPAVDTDGSVAWAANGVDVDGQPADTATVLYTDTLSGQPAYAYTDQLAVRQLTAVHDAVAVFNAVTTDGTRVVGRVDLASSPATVEQPWPHIVSLTAASPANGLMVGRTEDMTGSQRNCQAMLSYDDGSELWRTCEWIPQEFSLDGSRVFAIAADTEGFGPREVAVLDAGTGEVVQQLTTPGTFGRATFEDADTVDIVTVEDGSSAIVRCRSAGSCELATDPLPAVPDSLSSPYQLTANP